MKAVRLAYEARTSDDGKHCDESCPHLLKYGWAMAEEDRR